MKTESQLPRLLALRLPRAGKHRRLVVMTGARQTGKTTLACELYEDLRYLNLDAIEIRELLRGVRSARWGEEVGEAVLDEAQKEPGIFDKLKYAFDAGNLDFSVLLGSSRILLLSQIRESLAGRAFVYELWPLMACELARSGKPPLLDRLLRNLPSIDALLATEPPFELGERDERQRAAIAHLAAWGGMPALLPLDDDERQEWIGAYQQTYLERDLSDLAKLSDLLPFRTLQRLAMLRTGCLVSYADLARDAGLSPSTARRYLEYLRLTYQAVLLPPYHSNLTSRLVKAPKIYWSDLGMLRYLTQQWGPPDGEMFETLVVAEIVKMVSTSAIPVDLSFYRTRSGLEVDLLAEAGGLVLGMEVKQRSRISATDHRPMRHLAETLGEKWAAGFVVYTGDRLECLNTEKNIWAIPVHRLLA